jgi:hypothetical protein
MKFAVVENGIVVNVVEADEAYGLAQGWVIAEGNPSGVINSTYANGVFTAVRNLEGEWANVRQIRDYELAKSDVMVMPDRWNSLSDTQKSQWSAYRQALRNLPNNLQDPKNLWDIWPTEPSQ